MENQPTINLVIAGRDPQGDRRPEQANADLGLYETLAEQAQTKSKPRPQKTPEPEDSFEGIEASLVFDQDRPPIIFVPRKNNKIDHLIAAILSKYDLRLPVLPIRPGLYLIGPNRVNVDCKYEQAFVKVGAGSERLEQYLLKNDLQFRNKLIDYMNKSGKDLKWVVGQLKDGKQIKTAEFQELVVRRQASGTLFSQADSESLARQSRPSTAQRKRSNSGVFMPGSGIGETPSQHSKLAGGSRQARVRQFDQLQAPARAPARSKQLDSFTSGHSQSAAQASEPPKHFKNKNSKGIQLYPGEPKSHHTAY